MAKNRSDREMMEFKAWTMKLMVSSGEPHTNMRPQYVTVITRVVKVVALYRNQENLVSTVILTTAFSVK